VHLLVNEKYIDSIMPGATIKAYRRFEGDCQLDSQGPKALLQIPLTILQDKLMKRS